MGENDLEVTTSEAQAKAEEGAPAPSDDVRGEIEEAPAPEKKEEKPKQAEFKPEEEPVTYERFSKVYGRMRHLERELARAQAQGQIPPAADRREVTAQAVPQERPLEKNFDSYEKFVEALADWKVDQRVREERVRATEETARRTFERKLSEGVARLPDFQERAYLPNALVPIVIHSEMPAELAYHWGEHPEEALELLELPPQQQAYRIARIEAELRARTPPRREEPQTKFPQSRGVEGVREGTEKPLSKMSTEEYVNYMNKRDGIQYRSR